MKKRYMLLALVAVFAAGCQTEQQMLQSSQGMAVQTALNRARFDMNCSSATGQVLSTNVSQPSVQGRFASAYGVQRLVYTVGVTGCGKRRTYVVVCPQGGGGCFAAEGRGQ
jgi:PBP1b-binding outer membrane lipoprotein LpoB